MASLRWPSRRCHLALAALGGAESADKGETGAYERLLLLGARQRAAELGFDLGRMAPGPPGTGATATTHASLAAAAGLLLLPSWREADWPSIDWTTQAAVHTEDVGGESPLHNACPDHYNAVLGALRRAFARGYRRPGLCVERTREAQVEHRFTAALRAFQEAVPRCATLPPLRLGQAPRAEFLAWFRRHRPDVVLAHTNEIWAWMTATGARVPATHGFICLNWVPGGPLCAGLDLRPAAVAAAAVDLLVAQIRRNERGLPASPASTALAARWMEGPTLRDDNQGCD
jgi:LacI family transcriptional regulator